MNAHVSIDIDLSSGATAFADGLAALRRGPLQIPDHVDVVEWIEEHCMLSREVSAEPGPVSLYGYQKGLARLMADPLVQDLAVLKSARVGYTQIATFVVGYFVEHEAASVLVAQPTDDDAKDFGKSQIDSLFRETTALTSLIRERNLGDALDTWSDRRYRNGATLRLRGAASDDAFRRYTCRITVGDEIDGDAWRNTSTNAQGSKLRLMWERSRTFWNRKRITGSTPNVRESSLVYPEFLAGTQHRYFVPCPHCGEEQYLKWGGPKSPHGIKWSTDDAGRVVDAWYVCEHCEQRIDEGRKRWMDERGEFRATATPKRPGLVSVHVWAGMSLFPGAAWRVLAQEFLDAQGDPALLQPSVNLVLGEPWDAIEGKVVEPGALVERCEPYPAEVPDDVVVITAGIDTQKGSEDQSAPDAKRPRVEISLWGWGRGHECWLVGHYELDRHEPWSVDCIDEVDGILDRLYTKQNGVELAVSAASIDIGGGFGDQVKAYCGLRARSNRWAVKGHAGAKGTRRGYVWPRRASRAVKVAQNQHFMIDVQTAKDELELILKRSGRGPRTVHFPAWAAETDYLDGLTAEHKKRIKANGGWHWQAKNKKRNSAEEWVCWGYAYAALEGLRVSDRRWRDLNLAADKAGIAAYVPPHDPETGEILEESLVHQVGPDRSLQAPRNRAETPASTRVSVASGPNSTPEQPLPAGNVVETPAPAAKARRQVRVKRPSGGGLMRSRW